MHKILSKPDSPLGKIHVDAQALSTHGAELGHMQMDLIMHKILSKPDSPLGKIHVEAQAYGALMELNEGTCR